MAEAFLICFEDLSRWCVGVEGDKQSVEVDNGVAVDRHSGLEQVEQFEP